MSNSFYNRHNQEIVFTHQDQDLLEAYNNIKRFRIRNMKDLKGIVVNVRTTKLLDNCLIEIYQLNGKPSVHRFNDWSKNFLFKSAYVLGHDYDETVEQEVYVSTLIGYNSCFKFNSKVMKFIDMLKKADRFQQECIINNIPYTEDQFEHYKRAIEIDNESLEYF